MARSFYEYVEHRIVENFDFEAYAKIINEHVAEKGYVTPEEMHEAFDRLRGLVGGAARVAGGVLGAGKALGGAALKGIGKGLYHSTVTPAMMAAKGLGAAAKGVGAGVGAVGKGIGAAGSAIGQTAASGYQAGYGAEATAQQKAHAVQLMNNPLFANLPPAEQAKIRQMAGVA